MFLSLHTIVSGLMILFGLGFFLHGAKLAGSIMYLDLICLCPLIYYLESKNHNSLARYLFITMALIGAAAGKVGLKQDVNGEYFFISIMMAPILIFHYKEKFQILIGMALPVLVWSVTFAEMIPVFDDHWYPVNFPYQLFNGLDFLGVSIVTGFFLYRFNSDLSLMSENLAQAAC
jgi:hypothetical protein